MTHEDRKIAPPFASIIAAAANAAAPKRVAAYAERLHARGPTVMILDVSGSMAAVAWSAQRKIDILREAVCAIAGSADRIIAFSSKAVEIPRDRIPEPAGSTALHLALREAGRMSPSATLVVSDGEPDDRDAALRAAADMSGVIHTLYVGPDENAAAIRFMAELARVGLGSASSCDMRRFGPAQIAAEAQRLLPGRGQ